MKHKGTQRELYWRGCTTAYIYKLVQSTNLLSRGPLRHHHQRQCLHYEGKGSTVVWLISSIYGSIYGNDKHGATMAGTIESGQVFTIQVDTDAGTLKFWLDGKPHSPGYTSGVTGQLRWATNSRVTWPLRWGVSEYYIGNAVEIVPTPELLPWIP